MTRLMHDFSDDLLVLPTHGGGSFCGAAASGERVTTIGTERRTNPLARTSDLAHFLAAHAKQGEYPAYYRHMAPRNRIGRPLLGGAAPAVRQLTPADLEMARTTGSIVVDCRPHADFDQAHIPDSVSVPLHGPFSPWVGWVIDITTSIVLVARSTDDAEEATRQLIRIGFTDVGRWVDLADWTAESREVRRVQQLQMAELAESLLDGEAVTVVDVRQEREWTAGHIPGAIHALPDAMPALAATVDASAPVAVHCASGHRSAVAVSLLLRAGITDIWHITDGPDAWHELGHPLVSAA
jgi:hydroxyacylglutathione hydrolase